MNTKSSFSAISGDVSLTLRAGRIIYGLPARKLYCVAPANELSGAIVYCTVSEPLSGDGMATSLGCSYAVGDDVIFVSGDSGNSATNLLFGVILSTIPVGVFGIDKDQRSDELKRILEPGFIDPEKTDKIADLFDRLSDSLQLTETLGDKGFPDEGINTKLPGDYDITGLMTRLNVSASDVSIAAGKAKILLNGVYNMLDVCAPLIRINTLATESSERLINDEFFHITRKSLATEGKRGKNEEAEFRYVDELSNYIYGKRESLLSVDGLEISTISQTLDGKVSLTGANGVRIGKSLRTADSLTPVTPPVCVAPDAAIYSKEDIESVKNNEKLWDKATAEADQPTEDTLPPPDESEGLAELTSDNIGTFSDGIDSEEVKYGKILSYFDVLPSGGLILRDAWGSEIRMEGGNIQISAANNATTVAGRDILNICSGVQSTAAGEAVHIGANNKSVDIKGGKGINMLSEEGNIKLEAKDINAFSDNLNVDGTGFLRAKAKNLILGGEDVVVTGNKVTVHGKNSAAVASSKSAFILNTSAALSASDFSVRANLSVRKGSAITMDVPDIDGGTVKVTTAQSASGRLFAEGVIQTPEGIAATGQITSRAGVYAPRLACRGDGHVGRLSSSPRAVSVPSSPNIQHSPGTSASLLKDYITKCQELKDSLIFNIKSKAFSIWQPLFSKNSKNKTKTPIVRARDKNYIYPGESFWIENGLLMYNAEKEASLDPDIKYSLGAVQSLMLNGNNVEEIK